MAQQQDQQQLIESIQQQEQLLQPSRVVLGVDLDKINKPDYSDAKSYTIKNNSISGF